MRIVGIDPGPKYTAIVELVDERVILFAEKMLNIDVREWIWGVSRVDLFAVENIASFGLAVGREVFETCRMIGRIEQLVEHIAPSVALRLVGRMDVKHHICHSSRAKDANIRQALIDRFGGKEAAIGRKKSPGPLYRIKGDCWSALAVAITAAETEP